MTDPKKPGSTLTLKKKPAAPANENTGERKRSGARARQVAQLERVRQQQGEANQLKSRPHAQPKGPSASSDTTESRRSPAGSEPSAAPRITIKTSDRRSVGPRSVGPRSARASETFFVFTPCPSGLEEALMLELQALGFSDVKAGRAGCRLQTNWTGIQRINLYSRLATRVLVQVSQAPVQNEDDILALAYDTEWERWFGAEHTLRVDTSAIRSPMKSLQYCNLRAKDGICDRLRDREGSRPDIDTVRPDARVHLFLNEDSATLYLDTSGESLFKRGWRLDKGEAPIRENLAAGLLALSDWDPAQALFDPFCGSGTILIEGAWIALGVPPGIWRPFGFERLRNHDARLWRDLKDDARSHIATRLDAPLVGVDLNPAAIEAARQNVERAWLTPDTIRFEVGDARTVAPPADNGWIVTNPPYGERLPEDDPELWREWAQNLKRQYSGWQVHVISSDLDLPQRLRLKPRRRHPLYNGPLDCRLFSFDMVEAGYRRTSSTDSV
ncbi:MAG TPA: THUMP domain-containing protein [Pusillimonas sp.]|uniref:THUMP domain-containing class I SAM-dependent RNA methyltransferase n=1 Tax=Pusillimonas sp. TaxID=3040095 RepID=UPI002C36720C|nr:THUMP domain-containing protein [Pusillimonas sp.]HUH86691.1 THUMP domain-containing protein [Pusillimonas sp.]